MKLTAWSLVLLPPLLRLVARRVDACLFFEVESVRVGVVEWINAVNLSCVSDELEGE